MVHWLLTGNWEELSESFVHLPAWQRMVVPTAGGAAAGLVLMLTARFVKQSRTTDYMEAVVIGDGILSTRQSLLKSLSALFSISSGGSIGREGPLVQLAAMLASALGRILRVSSPRLRLLVACGAAAGIASAYNAPRRRGPLRRGGRHGHDVHGGIRTACLFIGSGDFDHPAIPWR